MTSDSNSSQETSPKKLKEDIIVRVKPPFTDLKPNAVFFIYITSRCQKICFNVQPSPSERVEGDLEQSVRHILKVDYGIFVRIITLRTDSDELAVYVLKFDSCTPCSKAIQKNFNYHGGPDEVFRDLPAITLDDDESHPAVSLPFFTLKRAAGPTNSDFLYPKLDEKRRVEELVESLKSHSFKAKKFVQYTGSFSQFSGGGDVLIENDGGPPLVVMSVPTTAVEEDFEKSPLQEGESSDVYLVIEAKKDAVDEERLKYQLWANMVILAVERFVARVRKSEYTIENILKLNQISTYGIAMSGDGTTGAFKVELLFDSRTNFVQKVALGVRDRMYAVRIVDKVLNFYKINHLD